MGKLEDLVHYPQEPRMPNMLLIGSSNNGKTRLIKQFAQRHLAEENRGGEHIVAPVLWLSLSASSAE